MLQQLEYNTNDLQLVILAGFSCVEQLKKNSRSVCPSVWSGRWPKNPLRLAFGVYGVTQLLDPEIYVFKQKRSCFVLKSFFFLLLKCASVASLGIFNGICLWFVISILPHKYCDCYVFCRCNRRCLDFHYFWHEFAQDLLKYHQYDTITNDHSV